MFFTLCSSDGNARSSYFMTSDMPFRDRVDAPNVAVGFVLSDVREHNVETKEYESANIG